MWTPEELATETGGIAEEWRIEVESVTDFDDQDPDWQPTLIPVDTELRAEIAHRMARNFHREMHYDFTPYAVEDLGKQDHHVYLIRSEHFTRLIPVVAGAVAIRIVQGKPVVMWAWIHPFERGGHVSTWSAVWDALTAIHGDLYVQAPLSHSMRAFITRRGVPPERIVTVG